MLAAGESLYVVGIAVDSPALELYDKPAARAKAVITINAGYFILPLTTPRPHTPCFIGEILKYSR